VKGLKAGLEENPHIHIDWIDNTNERLLELSYSFPTLKDKIRNITRDFTLLVSKIERLIEDDAAESEVVSTNPHHQEVEQEEQSIDTPEDDSIGDDTGQQSSEDQLQ